MLATQIWYPVWENPTCHGAAQPTRHNYWACALELEPNDWGPSAPEPVLLTRKANSENPVHGTTEWPLLATTREKPTQQQKPSTMTNNLFLMCWVKNRPSLHLLYYSINVPHHQAYPVSFNELYATPRYMFVQKMLPWQETYATFYSSTRGCHGDRRPIANTLRYAIVLFEQSGVQVSF